MTDQYKGHRAGSRKATIRRALDENGEATATALGVELKLSPATVRGWIRTWSKGASPKPAPASAGATTPPKRMRPAEAGDKKWVHLKGHPECRGVIVQQGDEQSVVRWVNGNEVVAVNSWLENDNA